MKHVDKGIDFAGLRILRCCQQCDIIGAIKGEKKFKGAHWHCYKCRNGFNRRDEAVKHYRTHFRNPLTTFQIHIAQEVYASMQNYDSAEMTRTGVDTMSPSSNDDTSLVGDPRTSMTNGHLEEDMQVSVETSESIRVDPGTKAIMIIREEHMESETTDLTMDEGNTNCTTMFVTTGQQILGDKSPLDKKVAELEHMYEELRIEKECIEAELRNENEQLKLKIEAQAKEIESLKKNEERLTNQLMGPVGDEIQQLLNSLRRKHNELLQQQLIQLRKIIVGQQTSNQKDMNQVLSSSDLTNDAASSETGEARTTAENLLPMRTENQLEPLLQNEDDCDRCTRMVEDHLEDDSLSVVTFSCHS